MGSGFSKMKKQARMMEQQMQAMQKNLQETKLEGTSGNGLVTCVMDGEKNLLELKIKPDCVDKDDIEGLEDLILAAIKDAHSKAESLNKSLPGFPF
jgi:hypothetical protein